VDVKQVTRDSDVDERLTALLTNASAVRAIASAVEGTIGSKGLDTMLVDRFGDVVITNDGITILTRMEVNHPAAKMVINTARAQEEEVGDGTTTATIMAGALLTEGVNQAVRGVPVTRIIEGIRFGTGAAVDFMCACSRPIADLEDPMLYQVALIAGRGHEDIARLVVRAAQSVGRDKLLDRGFSLADTVMAQESADNEVLLGVIIDKEPMNEQMPKKLAGVPLLILDDALEPEEIEDEALATESGFARYMELQEEFRHNLHKLVQMEVGLVVVDRGVHDLAEEVLTDAGVMVIKRVSSKEMRRLAEHTGARPIKRSGLKKSPEDLKRVLGHAAEVENDEKLEHTRVIGGRGKPTATLLVGASTGEVVEERERIAKDAAGAVQAAVRGGVVPGGGAVELAASRAVAERRADVKGMGAYGVDCVVEALRKPFAQIAANAGFNPLEKLGDVMAAQKRDDSVSLGIDCDTGDICDLATLGIWDPLPVKTYALKAAGEIAEAILRIDTIIKKRPEEEGADEPGGRREEHR